MNEKKDEDKEGLVIAGGVLFVVILAIVIAHGIVAFVELVIWGLTG